MTYLYVGNKDFEGERRKRRTYIDFESIHEWLIHILKVREQNCNLTFSQIWLTFCCFQLLFHRMVDNVIPSFLGKFRQITGYLVISSKSSVRNIFSTYPSFSSEHYKFGEIQLHSGGEPGMWHSAIVSVGSELWPLASTVLPQASKQPSVAAYHHNVRSVGLLSVLAPPFGGQWVEWMGILGTLAPDTLNPATTHIEVRCPLLPALSQA